MCRKGCICAVVHRGVYVNTKGFMCIDWMYVHRRGICAHTGYTCIKGVYVHKGSNVHRRGICV